MSIINHRASILSLCVAALWVPPALSTQGPAEPEPQAVTVAGSVQSELGCAGDWQPDCAATGLAFDDEDRVWQRVFNVPAGDWEYKAPLNGSWDVNFGANGIQNGANIPLSLPAARDVKFYYSHATHWINRRGKQHHRSGTGQLPERVGLRGRLGPVLLAFVVARCRWRWPVFVHRLAAGRHLRGQGCAERIVGCELRRQRRAKRRQHPV